MSKNRVLSYLFFGVFLVGFSAPVLADEGVIKLCPALSDEKTYGEDHEDFKFMVAGKDGWIFRTDYDLRQNKDDFDLSEWSLGAFQRLNMAFQKNGTEIVVAMIPTRGLIGHEYLLEPQASSYNVGQAAAGYGLLLSSIEKAGLIVADTRDVNTVDGFFLKRDNHWTAVGAKYLAQKVAEAVKAHPIYAGLKKAEFSTISEKLSTPIDANDNFLEFIEEICGKAPPSEKITETFTTTRKGSSDVGADLLGQGDKPEVVLLGTSNSTEPQPSYANFVGFLREALGVDVKNDSIMGGSMRGAIGNYVLTGDYKKYNPKLIIWELSAHYGFDQRNFFREIIPAVYGECSDAEAIAIAKGTVNPKETMIFENLEAKPMLSSLYYLYLKLEDTAERKVTVDFQHMGNEEDSIKFERSERNFPTNNGIYFAELRHGLNEPLKSVKITLKDGKGAYTAKMCKVPQ